MLICSSTKFVGYILSPSAWQVLKNAEGNLNVILKQKYSNKLVARRKTLLQQKGIFKLIQWRGQGKLYIARGPLALLVNYCQVKMRTKKGLKELSTKRGSPGTVPLCLMVKIQPWERERFLVMRGQLHKAWVNIITGESVKLFQLVY